MEPSRQAMLESIKNELQQLSESPLYAYRVENRYLPVPGEGSPDAAIMFIGEAPGEWEAKSGRVPVVIAPPAPAVVPAVAASAAAVVSVDVPAPGKAVPPPASEAPEPVVELPPLKGKPGKERYSGPVKPIKGAF